LIILADHVSMKENQSNGSEIWPESSQTFGYVKARKRHTIHMEGFLERAAIESDASKQQFIET
jgi:hypothetical protein